MLSECAWDAIARSLSLSPRELQIVRGVFDDKIEAAIAGDLAISVHTVHEHLRRLFGKLAVTTRTGLILRVWGELARLIISADCALPPLCPRWAAGRCLHGRRRTAAPRGQAPSAAVACLG